MKGGGTQLHIPRDKTCPTGGLRHGMAAQIEMLPKRQNKADPRRKNSLNRFPRVSSLSHTHYRTKIPTTTFAHYTQGLVEARFSQPTPISSATQPHGDREGPKAILHANMAPARQLPSSDTLMETTKPVRPGRLETKFRNLERLHRLPSGEIEIWTRGRLIGTGAFGDVFEEYCHSGPSRGTVRAVKRILKLRNGLPEREINALLTFSDPTNREVSKHHHTLLSPQCLEKAITIYLACTAAKMLTLPSIGDTSSAALDGSKM